MVFQKTITLFCGGSVASMSDNIAIKVSGVSKDFMLPHQKAHSIKGLFTSFYKKNRKKSTETQHALKDISFEIKKGEFFGIVGRNGSGKSTLLKIISGIYQPSKGSVGVNGRLVPFIELGVGFDPELSGRENVYLNGALLGFSTKEVDAKYKAIVDFAEIERFMDQKLKNYSSGMQVRLAFSVATVLAQSDILLIDEVLAVGDADFQRKCFRYFKKLKKDKKTVIFVSHDMSSVREYCDRVILVDNGNIISVGAAEIVSRDYMRLFNENEKNTPAQTGGRWGNKKATITNVSLSHSSLKDKNQVQQITLKLKANELIKSPILGFSIKNAVDQVIVGTNSKQQDIKIEDFQKDTQKEIIFTVPNIFSDGQYEIDVAILEEDALTVCDWWENSAKFTSFEDQKAIALASPVIDIKSKG